MHIIDELIAREFIKDVTDPDALRERMSAGPITYYTGYDPTNTSLMLQAHIQRAGHQPIVILGAGTAMVGDPSGKSKTREKVLSLDEIQANLELQRPQFEHFLGTPVLLNNADWLGQLHYLEFLRDIGRHFSVGEMIAAETYATRLNNNEHLSFTEFNYRLVQAYDFLHLFREHGCQLQVGGSDQWGNMVAGTELIRKVAGGKAWVLTAPLLLTSDGVKMGKTERGAVWLDPARTPPFDYFQYWMNVEDALVSRLLKQFTFMPLDAIEGFLGGPIQTAKTKLALEATALAHGRQEGLRALSTSMLLFGLDRFVAWDDVVEADDGAADPDVPKAQLERASLDAGLPLFKLFVDAGLAGSGKQAKNLAKQGGAYVNGEAMADPFATVQSSALRPDGTLLLRAGKKKYCLVTFA
jgi:tyrosyl-tRNA synthetase